MKTRTVLVGLLALGGALLAGAIILPVPLKIATPQLFGMHCAAQVCTEDEQDLAAALELFRSARGEVEALADTKLPNLHAVMCKSDACYARFGGGAERAISFPFLGMVVAGRSWQNYIVRHEMIHWLQFEHFGAFETMSYPAWFREGMAYALSEAPASDIPPEFVQWMAQYREWEGKRSLTTVLSNKPLFD